MTKIKCIVFDMDGVLIDAKDWHYEALNKALAIFGLEISRYDHLVTYDGLPTKKKLEILSSHSPLPKQLHSFINDLKQIFTMDITMSKCAPTFCHEYAISKLKSDGYRMAVCSNSIRDTITSMLSKAALINYFDFYLSNQDVSKSKPDPEIYLKAIERFGVLPSECLVLEDNANGIRAATDAGAHVMQIDQVTDVNYANIMKYIQKIESAS
ncbi:HAD family phosphatase [Polynucleobacter sp. AP-Feld-500C-C5]|uniref:HAD family hydrolase n=1 Tax=Polynucleobacter sp. AP-Feld-500C-C5 TaxID=2576924 RepID=UPI001C0AE002|nr:HAD family phosphatase [Polynucleobacter sp. AP-Feld-500C-C5]MBU3632845.1 HAD family phosphatase [Polynucleobacter sp. AP-Feld-500C-C5]